MSKKELVKALMERMQNFGYFPSFTNVKIFIKEYEKLAKPEPQAGHADEAPLYLRNVISRLRELPLHDREVWLKAIMDEFEEDFCHSIWREGYEQGKFEGEFVGQQLKDADKIRRELNKPVVPQFVANWYEEHEGDLEYNIWEYLYDWHNQKDDDFKKWMNNSSNKTFKTLVNMHQFGYTVEKEKRYLVKIKSTGQCLGKYYINNEILSQRFIYTGRNADGFTRKELEEAGFGWVFDCEGIEIEEVTE